VQVETSPLSFTDLMWRSTGGAITFAGQSLVVGMLVFYFLAADDLFKRKFVKIAGTLSEKRLTVEILNDIERHIARYLAARFLISVIVAVATALTFWWLGMSQPAVWGLIAGILNVIPYVGPTVVTLAATVAAFLQFGSAEHAFWVGITETGINVLEGFVLTPVLMGKAGRMNGAAVFISLTIWGFLWGLWGLLLGVPLTMALKVLCDRVEALSPVAELLGE
jgi:predicted PurR-regulated permease PerM